MQNVDFKSASGCSTPPIKAIKASKVTIGSVCIVKLNKKK